MSSSFTLDWDGDNVSKDIRAAVIEALKDGAEMILDESNKIAPIDNSQLINSGNTSVDTEKLTANVYYDTPYAVEQHERLDFQHLNGRQAKFLETAWKENESRVRKHIAEVVKRKVG